MNITEIVQSPRWKKFMGYTYGWGASIVLIGALFKIQHYPGAGIMLTIGMGVEALIFFFSAFEPPHEDPDWSLVYPELIGLEPRNKEVNSKSGEQGDMQSLLQNMNIDPKSLSQIGQGLNKLSNTAEQLADISEATIATDNYVRNINTASESIGKFASGHIQSTEILNKSAQQLQESYSQTASLISDSGKNIAQQISQSGASILDSYSKLSESLTNDFQKLTVNSNTYGQQLEGLNKNLSSLNNLYELQLNHTNEQIQRSQDVHKDLNKIVDNLASSLENAQVYKQETEQLSKNLEALNTIYGNMLSAMDINKKRS